MCGEMLSAGLQGEVCESDIRQHAKLPGQPQQWNWRRLIDRLLGDESQSR